MKKLLLFLFPLFCNYISNAQNSCNCNTTICNQIWMTHNLQTSYYRNGDPIPNVTNSNVWVTLTTGAWCWYKNDSVNYSQYGKLYNWYAVNDPRGLAPTAWHIPTDAEWTTLETCLGGPSVAGGAMKATSGWLNGGNGTNSSGFTGLPGGFRGNNGTFSSAGYGGFWRSSTQSDTIHAWARYLEFANGTVTRYDYDKPYGFSVRCIKN